MASITLAGGLYLKDIEHLDTPGTWTGFVELNGRNRLVVALKVVEEDSRIKAANPRAENYLEWVRNLNNWSVPTFDVAPDGTKFIVFVPPE
jgi:hypothetical protein